MRERRGGVSLWFVLWWSSLYTKTTYLYLPLFTWFSRYYYPIFLSQVTPKVWSCAVLVTGVTADLNQCVCWLWSYDVIGLWLGE